MRYNRLGKTDINISEMTLGSAQFSNYQVSQETAGEIIRTALDAGINYIDTAFFYGQGRSEQMIGKALEDVPREQFYIGTKVGRYHAETDRMWDFSAERTLREADGALKRLKVEYLDILFAHDVEYAPSEDMVVGETLPALQRLKDLGKVKYIGITGYPLRTLRSIVETSSVAIDVIITYARGTLFDEALLDHVHFFRDRRIGIINASPTGMSLLTPGGPPPWHPAKDDLKELCARAREYASTAGVSIAKLALKHSMTLPGDSLLFGAYSVDILRDNLSSYDEPLCDNEKETLTNILGLFGDRRQHWEGEEVRKLTFLIAERERMKKELIERNCI